MALLYWQTLLATAATETLVCKPREPRPNVDALSSPAADTVPLKVFTLGGLPDPLYLGDGVSNSITD